VIFAYCETFFGQKISKYESIQRLSQLSRVPWEQGFTFHRFSPLVSSIVQPMLINNDIYGQLSQVTYADAVFIKDFIKFEQLSSEKLKIIALILNDIYESFDIVLRALMAHDLNFKSSFVEKYEKYLF
jgi:hypothetical protein